MMILQQMFVAKSVIHFCRKGLIAGEMMGLVDYEGVQNVRIGILEFTIVVRNGLQSFVGRSVV